MSRRCKRPAKKVALVYFSFLPTIGGAELALATFALYLKRYFDVYVLTTKSYNLDYYPNFKKYQNLLGLSIVRFNYINIFNKIWKYAFFSPSLIKFLLKHRFDLIVVFSSLPSFFTTFTIILGKLKGSNIIIRPMFNPRRYTIARSKILSLLGRIWDRVFLPKLLEQADMITALTHFEKIILKEIIKSNKIITIPDPIIVKSACKTNTDYIRRKYEIPKASFTLLYVGRAVEYKGLQYLLQALGMIKDYDNVILIIVGPQTRDLTWIKNVINKFNLEKRVKILGKISYQDLLALYCISDVVVIPSLYETLSRVALEALALGKPIIISKYVPIAPIVKFFNCGIVIDPKDLKEFSNAILMLLLDEDFRATISRNAKRVYQLFFNYKNVLKTFKEIIENIEYNLQRNNNSN